MIGRPFVAQGVQPAPKGDQPARHRRARGVEPAGAMVQALRKVARAFRKVAGLTGKVPPALLARHS